MVEQLTNFSKVKLIGKWTPKDSKDLWRKIRGGRHTCKRYQCSQDLRFPSEDKKNLDEYGMAYIGEDDDADAHDKVHKELVKHVCDKIQVGTSGAMNILRILFAYT